MFSLEAEIHHYIEILEPVLRDAGQEMWQALDRIISAKNAMEGIGAKEMYIRGFLDYERLVCEKDSNIWIIILRALIIMVGASFLIFFQNHLTFFKFPRVISGKIIFSAKVPSKCPLKLAISEGIFHLCEKNLQKGVGKYRFPGFIGRGTIILKILPQRCPLLPVSVQSMWRD